MKHDSDNRTALPVADVEQDISNAPMAKEDVAGFNSLVNIRVTSYRKRKHDPDGISVKAVLDGLVRRKILVDDSTSEVNKVSFQSIIVKKGEPEKTIIVITDAD